MEPIRICMCPKCQIVHLADETGELNEEGRCSNCDEAVPVYGIFTPDTPKNNLLGDALDRIAQAADKIPGLPDSILDDIVHELASSLGSDTNNDGFEAQARFVLKDMGIQSGEKAIMEIIDQERAKSTRSDPSPRGPDEFGWYYCQGECPLCKSTERKEDGTQQWDDGTSKHFICTKCYCEYHEFYRDDNDAYANTTVDEEGECP